MKNHCGSKIILFGTLLCLFYLALNFYPKAHLSSQFSSSIAVYDSKRRLLRLTLSKDDKYRLWVPLHQFSPNLIQAVLLHEDRHFYRHSGVNPISLIRATYETYIKGGRRMGGSTLSMQLARLVYKINSRTVFGKVHQIVRTFWLEWLYSKNQILEAYLNLTPYGANIEGAGAASLIYFEKSPDQLTLPEAITLAVLPQSPTKRSANASSNQKLFDARLRLFTQWKKEHPEDSKYEPFFKLPVVMKEISDLPFSSPHFVNLILKNPDTNTQIATTLDLDLQRLLERQVRLYIARNSRVGINNAASLLVNYKTMEVKAMVGSASFFNNEIQGQVNGTTAKRSPGSALKPFVYALGLDQGILHPETILKDTPTTFGAFNPENFDGKFVGPISVREALIRSRNVPAIWVSTQLSQPGFYDFLKAAGIAGLKSERHYGPSLVIGGGGEVTMEELTTLYAMLANKGVLKKLRHQANESFESSSSLISPEASYMVLDILKDNPTPDEHFDPSWISGHFPVFWKTGTSYGFRDAWSVGIFGPYVLAVWVGNFNGEGNPSFVGIKAAAPLFFQMIDSIKANISFAKTNPFKMPEDLQKVEVCALSGRIPGPFCKRTKMALFMPGKSPIEHCDIHREVLVDNQTGRASCPPYDPKKIHSEIFEFWSSDILKLYGEAGIPRKTPPPPDTNCRLDVLAANGNAPKITSPESHRVYMLRSTHSENETIPFLATTDADAKEIYWFVGDNFIGRSKSGLPFIWQAIPGNYTVRAVDDRGRSDYQNLKVAVIR